MLAKNIMFNFIGLGLPMFVALLAIPQLINLLGTDRFGVLTLIWVVISYTSLFDLGLGRALTQQLSARMVNVDAHINSTELVWTSLISLSILGIVGSLIICLFAPNLVSDIIHVPISFRVDSLHAFYVLALALPFVIATDCVRGILESHQAFGIVNAVRLPMGIFTFVGPLLALQFAASLTLIAIFLALGKIVNFLLYFYFCFRVMPNLKQKITFNRKDLLPLLAMGGWTTISNIISPFMGYLDRFFIATISLSAVTYYVTSNELITKLWLIPGAMTAVFFPEFTKSFILNPIRLQLLFQQNLKYVFLLLFPLILVIIYFPYQLLQVWLGRVFAEASYHVLQWLAVGVLINSLAQVAFTLLQASGKAHITAKIHLLELPFYFAALWLGAKYGSIETIALIWFLRMVIDTLMMFISAYYCMPFAVSPKIIWLVCIIGAIIIGSFLLSSLILKIIVFILSLLTVGGLFWYYLLSASEKQFFYKPFQMLK